MSAKVHSQTDDDDNGLQVVGVGWGRTGTKTLYKVLTNDFGMKCYHMEEVKENSGAASLFYQIATSDPNDHKKRQKLFDQIFLSNTNDPYLATIDWPTTKFWRDLVDYYPNSKVLLTIRDPQKWYKSAQNSIVKVCEIMNNTLLVRLNIIKYLLPWLWRHMKVVEYCAMGKLPYQENINIDDVDITDSFCGKFQDKEYILDKFNRHIEQVKKYVSKDRLIIIDVTKHGYNELIDGLKDVKNIKIPNNKRGQPFPKLNSSSTKDMEHKIRIVKILCFITDVMVVGCVLLVGFLCYKLV